MPEQQLREFWAGLRALWEDPGKAIGFWQAIFAVCIGLLGAIAEGLRKKRRRRRLSPQTIDDVQFELVQLRVRLTNIESTLVRAQLPDASIANALEDIWDILTAVAPEHIRSTAEGRLEKAKSRTERAARVEERMRRATE